MGVRVRVRVVARCSSSLRSSSARSHSASSVHGAHSLSKPQAHAPPTLASTTQPMGDRAVAWVTRGTVYAQPQGVASQPQGVAPQPQGAAWSIMP